MFILKRLLNRPSLSRAFTTLTLHPNPVKSYYKNPDEILALCDISDNEIGFMMRRLRVNSPVINRCSSVVLMTPESAFYVQKRKSTKSWCPGYWDLTFGGLVRYGESYQENAEREIEEEADAITQQTRGFRERRADLRLGAFNSGGVWNAPMGGHRLPGPDRADLAGGVVANRENEIERRRAGRRELVPRLGAKIRDLVAAALDDRPDVRVDAAGRHRARRIGLEAPLALLVHQRLGDYGTRRIAGAEEEDVEGLRRVHGRDP